MTELPRRVHAGPSAAAEPAQLRSIFGQNLRQLVAGEGSIASLCRALSINRTQFNRYLAGETFPRPDVLDRICRHFNVDARILLEPIEAQAPCPATLLGSALATHVLEGSDFTVDPARLPDGIYRFWRSSYNFPNRVLASMCRVSRENGVTLFKAYEPPNPMQSDAARAPRSASVFRGVFLQHDDGVSLYCSTHGSGMVSISFFEFGIAGMPDFLGGLSFLTRRRIPGVRRMSFTVLEHLPQTMPAVMAAARECGLRKASDVPLKLRDVLATVPASI